MTGMAGSKRFQTNAARNHTKIKQKCRSKQKLSTDFGTWRGAVRAGFAAAAASPASPLLPAAKMPLPVISFHLGAEHGFLEERPTEVSLRSTEVNESLDPNQRTTHEHESSARSKGAGIGGVGEAI